MPHGAHLFSLLVFCRKLSNKEMSTMRDLYKQALKVCFHRELFHTRMEVLDVTQEEMAQRLCLSCRSYVDLDHGQAACSAVTLALFLVYICNDPDVFLERLWHAFETVKSTAA